MGAALFLMSAAFLLARTARDALFMTGEGVYALPFAYLGIAALSVPAAFGTLAAMRRFGARRVRVVAPLAMSAVLLLFATLARPGGGPTMTAFFIVLPLAFGVLFSLTWLLCADVMDGEARATLARAYSLVGAGSILGSLARAVASRLLGSRVDPRVLILLGAAATGAASAVVVLAQRRFPSRLVPAPAGPAEPMSNVLRGRYPLILLFIAMAGSLVGVLLEFLLYITAAASGGDARANARFFAGVYTVLNGIALIVQLTLMPPLQRAVGVPGSLLVLPSALLAGVAFGGGSLAARSALRVMEGGLRSSIHRVNWEQAFLPLARPQRAAAKVMVDGAGARLAEAAAAVALLVWLYAFVGSAGMAGADTTWIRVLLACALVTWVVLTWILRGRMGAAAAPADDEMRLAVPLPDS